MAIQSITKPMALDETLQSTNTALGGVAKDTTLQSTNGKMDSVITKLQGIIDALGVDTSVYKAAGNKACAELIPALLVASNLGNVYNITDSGTTTSDFVEGAGKEIHVGDNVAIVDIGAGGSNVYKFDLLAGMVDLSNYVQKEAGKGLSSNDYTTAEKNKLAGISANAKKVESSTTNGNIKIDGTETQVYNDSEIQGKLTTDTTTSTGNPINFSTKTAQNAVSTIIDLEPIQDLHGFDKPWVGGAGKNKLFTDIANIKSVNTGGTWSGNTFTLNNVVFTILTDSDGNVTGIKANGLANADTSIFIVSRSTGTSFSLATGTYILSGCPANGSSSTYMMQFQATRDGSIYQYGVDYGEGASGEVLSTDRLQVTCRIKSGYNAQNIIFYPMIRLSTETDPTFAPYTNYASISGRTEIGIEGCGKNLAKMENGGVNDYGENTWSDTRIRNNGYISVIPGQQYSFSATPSNAQGIIRCFSKKGEHYTTQTTWGNSHNITIPADVQYVRIIGRNSSDTSITADDVNFQFEKGTATACSPYTESNNISIQLDDTVYGGTLDVKKGELIVDRGYDTVGNLNWTYVSANAVFYSADITDEKKAEGKTIISSDYQTLDNVTSAAGVSQDASVCLYRGTDANHRVYIKDTRYTDASIFKTTMSSVQLAYELAEPITIQLTPHQISLLKGVNNISVSDDYSEITLTYRSGEVATLGDLKEAIDNLPSGGDYHEYSTEEKVVGKWTDGKLIYEKTINNASVTRSSWTNIAHNISNIDTKIAITGMLIRTSDGWTVNLTYYENGASVSAVFGDTNVSIFANVSTGNYIANVILQYTKTT